MVLILMMAGDKEDVGWLGQRRAMAKSWDGWAKTSDDWL